MKRSLTTGLLALPLAAVLAVSLGAEVKTRDKTQVKFEGMLGKMLNLFGGKGAKDGIVSATAVKGQRKASISDTTGQIVDLGEEKVYNLDMKKREYTVTTFEEIRRQIREAREKAEKEAAEARKEAQKEQKEQKEENAEKSEPAKELDVDFDVKETGQKKQVAGYDTREVVMTISVREKGKKLDESGGLVMTSDMWLGADIPAMREAVDFEIRYWKQLQGGDSAGVSAEQMATAMALYPMLKPAMDRMKQESGKLSGTPMLTVMTLEAVKSTEAMKSESSQPSGGSGGLSGMLARKMMKKEDPKQRATIFTTQHEMLEISTTVAPADLEIPAGFKEKK
ncbi:MAG: hypothetical protein ABIS06_20825 [Vicinamibacterales bacterium]